MIIINKGIKSSTYEKLIKYAFDKCNIIMFVSKEIGFDADDIATLRKNMVVLESLCKSDLILQLKRPNWVFSEIINDDTSIPDEKFDSLFNVYFYKFSNKLKSYLLSNRDLYAWLNPKYPEDIAFFKDGVCWLYSVTHEGICDIYVDNEEEYNYLKNIGLEFIEESYREILKEEIYVEKLLLNND